MSAVPRWKSCDADSFLGWGQFPSRPWTQHLLTLSATGWVGRDPGILEFSQTLTFDAVLVELDALVNVAGTHTFLCG